MSSLHHCYVVVTFPSPYASSNICRSPGPAPLLLLHPTGTIWLCPFLLEVRRNAFLSPTSAISTCHKAISSALRTLCSGVLQLTSHLKNYTDFPNLRSLVLKQQGKILFSSLLPPIVYMAWGRGCWKAEKSNPLTPFYPSSSSFSCQVQPTFANVSLLSH